jgi:hypothetical protein
VNRFARNRDYYAGALVALIGAGAIAEGQSYGFGSLGDVGPGFFPVLLGVGLVAMGALMAATSGRGADSDASAAAPDRRGTVAIVLAVALFIALADTAGLAPATIACVFAGALGTRTTTWRQAALLALGVTVFGVLLFSLGLKVQFPIIRGVLQ